MADDPLALSEERPNETITSPLWLCTGEQADKEGQELLVQKISKSSSKEEALEILADRIAAMNPQDLLRNARRFCEMLQPGSRFRERMIRELAGEIQRETALPLKKARQTAEKQINDEFQSLKDALNELEEMLDPNEAGVKGLIARYGKVLALAARAKAIFTRLVAKHIGILAGLLKRSQNSKPTTAPAPSLHLLQQSDSSERVPYVAPDDLTPESAPCSSIPESQEVKKKDLIIESGTIFAEECREEEKIEHKQEIREEEELMEEKLLIRAVHGALEELARVIGEPLNYSPAIGSFIENSDIKAWLAVLNQEIARAHVTSKIRM